MDKAKSIGLFKKQTSNIFVLVYMCVYMYLCMYVFMCAYVYMLFQRNVKVGSDEFFLPCRPNAEKDHFLSVKNNLILSYFDLKELR